MKTPHQQDQNVKESAEERPTSATGALRGARDKQESARKTSLRLQSRDSSPTRGGSNPRRGCGMIAKQCGGHSVYRRRASREEPTGGRASTMKRCGPGYRPTRRSQGSECAVSRIKWFAQARRAKRRAVGLQRKEQFHLAGQRNAQPQQAHARRRREEARVMGRRKLPS